MHTHETQSRRESCVFSFNHLILIIIIIIIMGFAVAFPRGGSSSTVSRSNWNLEVLVFDERGKPEKNLSSPSVNYSCLIVFFQSLSQ